MSWAHDLGGRRGFGRVRDTQAEYDEPVFHTAWERRVFALVLAMAASGHWSLDASRHARESLDALTYLTSDYYTIWFLALERLVEQAGIRSQAISTPHRQPVSAADIARAFALGTPTHRHATTKARFAINDRIRVRCLNPSTHHRLPSYIRGCCGSITHCHGHHVLPDSHARGQGENPTPLYNVRFAARDLWGHGQTVDAVHVDLWESYLEPA